MKYIAGIIVLVSSLSFSKAQTGYSSMDTVKAQFLSLYNAIPLKINDSWSEKLSRVNEIFFDVHNEFMHRYFNGLLKGKPDSVSKFIIRNIADTLNRDLLEHHAFDLCMEDTMRLHEILPEMASATCDCVNARAVSTGTLKALSAVPDLAACANAYVVGDSKRVLKIRLAFAGYNMLQIWRGSQTSVIYAVTHCPLLYKFYLQNMTTTAASQYVSTRYSYGLDMADVLAHLYKAGKTDSLHMYFPLYKNYSTQLATVSQVKYAVAEPQTLVKGDTMIVTTTYLNTDKQNPRLAGQALLYFSNDATPQVIKMQFIQRGQIHNLAALEKKLREANMVAPPPRNGDIVTPAVQ